jgi:EAL domain-containing protein (putative c-di-GMP-specific phosphodiesterase class I)
MSRGFLASRLIRLLASIALCGAMGGMLAATIYWTLFDPRWVTFLGGVLFAAVLSLVSHASKAEWIVARRTRQLERERARLAEASARSARATAAFQTADMRLRRLGEVLRSAVMFIDRDQVCRCHNHALEEKVGLGTAIDGRALREIVGDATYAAIRPHVEESLAGSAAAYDLHWRTPSGNAKYHVRQLPSQPGFPGNEVCVLLTPAAVDIHAEAPAPAAAGRIAGGQGETLYLRAIAKELTGWSDPKAKLTRALAEDRFLLLAQQIKPLELGGADPLCYEILLRLQEEEDHLLPPGGFLPEAERFGMMEELDRWVLRHLITVCLAQQKRDARWQLPLYCLNLSSAAIRSPGFARFVQAQIEMRKFEGRALCFEVSEHDLISLQPDVRRLVAMLKPFGCRFTIDAFGSVNGSFAPLKDLAADFIKIDGIVIQNILRDPAQEARARAISAVCRKIGMRSIAEFVEERETLHALRRIGVDYVQGFGIARPAPLVAALEATPA